MHISVNKISRWHIYFEISRPFLINWLSYLIREINLIVWIILLDSERVVAIGVNIRRMLGDSRLYEIWNFKAPLQIDTSGWILVVCLLGSAEPIQVLLLNIFQFLVFNMDMIRRYLSPFYFWKKVSLL